MTIGYVGLGNMGGALARRLQLQHQVMVYDMDAGAVDLLAGLGATPSASLTDLASSCDVIMLCLPTSHHVRDVIFGENGLISSVMPGTMIVDQTSGDPNATRAMAVELAGRGVELIDAPVSGGAQGADAGTIAIMVGATPQQYLRVSPILSGISSNVFHAGEVGAGHVVKLVNNLISGAQRLLTLEGVALAVKNGLDPQTVVDILAAGGARNAFLDKAMGPEIIGGTLGAPFAIGLLHKDVTLACQLGIASDVPMFFGNLTRDFYQMCISEVGREAKVNSVALVIDRLSGTRMVPEDHG